MKAISENKVGQKKSPTWIGFALLFMNWMSLEAFEFRDPVIVREGPLRHFFEEPEDAASVRTWAVPYARHAKKAFSEKQGRHFQELSSLFFNASDFRATQMFANCYVPLDRQNYFPLLRTAVLSPRIHYTETGVAFGGKMDLPIDFSSGKQVRVGLRVSSAVKRCMINKIDTQGVRSGAELQDVYGNQPATALVSQGGSSSSTVQIQISHNTLMFRLDFLEALRQSDQLNSFLQTLGVGTNATMNAGAVQVSTPLGDFSSYLNNANLSRNFFVMIYSPEGTVPSEQTVHLTGYQNSAFSDNQIPPTSVVLDNVVQPLPADGNVSPGVVYQFVNGVDYSKFLDSDMGKSVMQRVADQNSKATIWVIPVVAINSSSPDIISTQPGGVLYTAQQLSNQVTQNLSNWLAVRGQNFQSFIVDDFGDTRVDATVDYQVNERVLIGAFGGVSIPTAQKTHYAKPTNPYRIQAGNGGHFEVSVGGMLAFQTERIFDLKMDGRFSWVLNRKEERSACFQNALIKNLGPKVDADVRWSYFEGNIDLNFTHPGTQFIKGMIGYRFFYKNREHLRYSVNSMVDWLGQTWVPADKNFIDNAQPLSATLATQNTLRISHSLKLEASCLFSEWIECVLGGDWAFAGKNAPYNFGLHAGINVAF